MFANLPADMPIFGGLPLWLALICIVTVLLLAGFLNNLFFQWFRQKFPGYFRPRNLLAILVFAVLIISVGMWLNPPSKVREEFRSAHPELVSKPAK